MLSLFVAAALAAGAAQAADKTPAPAAPRAAPTAQQQAARAEIDRLVKRIEELSKQLGEGNDVRVIVRKDHRHGPGDAPEAFEWQENGDGDREVVIRRLGPGEAPEALPGDGKRVERIERVGPGGKKWKVEGFPESEMGFGSGPGLGIVMAANTAASGVRIAAVTPDSPAQKAGIRTDDVLLQVNGKTIAGNGKAAVENARTMIGKLEKGQVVKLRYARQGKTYDASVRADEIHRVMAFRRDDRLPRSHAPRAWREDEFDGLLPPGVELELQRIGPHGDCKGKGKGKDDCGMPVIYEAFRWQGLNLASIDAGLGRYFGASEGVLVLSSGEDIKGLQSGDVIQRVGGVAVASPRDVMRALRDKDAGSQLKFDLMRDKRAMAVSVTVPKPAPLPFMTPPPPPPAPPAAPRAPAPPPPPPREGAFWTPAPEAIEDVLVVSIDDGEDDEAWEVTAPPAR
jgi:hypothetical protein